jgi:aminoglycoside phosphotransferase (APT) family kinase protein
LDAWWITVTRVDPEPRGGRPTTSTRNYDDVRDQLRRWLQRQLPDGAAPEVSSIKTPTSTGMSSETLLFDATWQNGGQAVIQPCAARLRPDMSAVPVFASYDLDMQYRLMGLVAEKTALPVPRTLWFEADEEPLGSPFFVMERVDGEAPPDIMPYVFGSWLFDAAREDQQRLQRAAVGVLGALHAMPFAADEVTFLEGGAPGDTSLRRHFNGLWQYYQWVAGRIHFPTIERAFAYLDEHWPKSEGPTAVSWGDARIGNILWRDFEPVAMLDWEMASLAPREVDLSWMIYLHWFFQELAVTYGMPGMPEFMNPTEVVATYEEISGYGPRDMDWFLLYAAVRHGVVMTRCMQRSVHFGEAPSPSDPEELTTNRDGIRRLMEGTYWS